MNTQTYIAKPKKTMLFDAMDDAQKSGEHYTVPVSEDINKNAFKTFYAFKSHQSLYDYILSKPIDKRYLYEIIRTKQPSIFYLDVDHYDGCGLDIIHEVVKSFDSFLISIKLTTGKPLVLQANSQSKESYHFLWRTPWLLACNQTRRRMFDLFERYLIHTNSPLISCTNTTSLGEVKKLLDPAVYTIDQNFRCIHCSKFGSVRPLEPIAEFTSDNFLDFFITYRQGDEITVTLKDLPVYHKSAKSTTKPVTQRQSKSEGESTGSCSESAFLTDYNKDLPNPFHSEISTIIRDNSLEYILKCIPNGGSGQPWNVWLSIGMALHRESMMSSKQDHALNIGFELFDLWSKCSIKYDEQQVRTSWKSFSTSYREIGYNRSTLIRLAKEAYPELFQPDFQPFEDLHSDYAKYIEHYDAQYVSAYDKDVELYFESSPMGSGKTHQIAQMIKTHNPKRIICLSPKQSFATNFCAGLNEALGYTKDDKDAFVNYLDLMKDELFDSWHNVDRIVIQMESLYKVNLTNFQKYDLLVADESESLLKCFNSATMLTPVKGTKKSRLSINFATFEKIVKTSNNCIFADAFITRRTLDVVNSLKPFEESSVKIRINDHTPTGRKAIRYSSYKVFEDRMIQHLTENKRIVIFWGSKRRGKEFISLLKTHLPTKIVKFYHADANDDMDADLEQVNLKWSEDIDVLMYSAKITVGVNYTVPNHFDDMFVYGYAGGACARDVTQSILRVRMTKSNTLHYFADARCYLNECPTTYTSLNAVTEWKVKNLHMIQDSIEKGLLMSGQKWSLNSVDDDHMKISRPISSKEHPWMTHLFLLNQLEDNLSRTYYHINLARYLEKCGYSMEDEVTEMKEDERPKVTVLYKSIPDCDDLECLEAKIQRKEGSAQDKLVLKKAQFNRLVNLIDLTDDNIQALWTFHNIIERLKILKRIKYITVPSVEELKTFGDSSIVGEKVLYELCTHLGVSNPLITQNITVDQFNACCQYVENNLRYNGSL